MSDFLDQPEADIIRSWHTNARQWTKALRCRQIASRRLVTDQAIIDAVLSVAPCSVLDMGCGEGWLARALMRSGVEVLGIDVVPALIAEAKRLGPSTFEVHSYLDVAAGTLKCRSFDAVVCNFSLLGRESVEVLIGALDGCLNPGGHFVLQTLHPVAACGALPYRDGWRPGSWAGFSDEFSDPPPWFFRTVASWYAMLRRCGFDVVECREPTADDASAPSSLIFICRRAASAGTGAL